MQVLPRVADFSSKWSRSVHESADDVLISKALDEGGVFDSPPGILTETIN
jgi:hypothetical protein